MNLRDWPCVTADGARGFWIHLDKIPSKFWGDFRGAYIVNNPEEYSRIPHTELTVLGAGGTNRSKAGARVYGYVPEKYLPLEVNSLGEVSP